MQGNIIVALFHLCWQGKNNSLSLANKVQTGVEFTFPPKVFQIRSATGRLCVYRKRNNAISTCHMIKAY